MKQFIFGITIGVLFFFGCAQKKENIEINNWNKFKDIPTYKATTTKVHKIISISDDYNNNEDVFLPPTQMPFVVSTLYRDGYNDAMKSLIKTSNQKDYLNGFEEGIKDKKDGLKKNLIVRDN